MTELEVENYMNNSPSIQRRVPAREPAETMDGKAISSIEPPENAQLRATGTLVEAATR